MKFGHYKNEELITFCGIVFNLVYPATIDSDKNTEEYLKTILQDAYFGMVAISNISNKKTKKNVKKLLTTSHIDVNYIAAFSIYKLGLNPSSVDEAERKFSVKELKKSIDEAVYFGAKRFLILSGKDPGVDFRGQAKESLIKSISSLCEYSKNKSLDEELLVMLEPLDREFDKKFLIGPSKEAKYIADSIRQKYDNFGISIDYSHILGSFETPKEYIYNLKDHIVDVHINNCVIKDKNNPFYGDKHVRFGMIDSEIDVNEITEYLKIFRDIGYFSVENFKNKPTILFEVMVQKDEDPEIIISNFKRVFNLAWIRIQIED